MNNTPAQAREIVAQALESGEYTQGYGCLEHRDEISGVTHCCLGIATREYMKCEQHSITAKIFPGGKTSFRDNSACLCAEVQAWLGFTTSFGGYSDSSLSSKNDSKVLFSEIAKLFRNPPKGLLAQ